MEAWRVTLRNLGLLPTYPSIITSLEWGFDAGVPPIRRAFAPCNGLSIQQYPDTFRSIVNHKFSKGRYLGPFSVAQVKAMLGPFQTSPLSLVPKSSPGKFRLVQNLSFPHNTSFASPARSLVPFTLLINAAIDSDAFPCTWGTFNTVALLIACLPPGSQVVTCDVAEAYRTIPLHPSQWPGTVVRLDNDDSFAINTSNCFGLASASRVWGLLADTLCTAFSASGIGPVSKWVDDFVFFCLLVVTLAEYNNNCKQWARQIQQMGGQQWDCAHLWFQGKSSLDGKPSKFDEDCTAALQDLSLGQWRIAPSRMPIVIFSRCPIPYRSLGLWIKALFLHIALFT